MTLSWLGSHFALHLWCIALIVCVHNPVSKGPWTQDSGPVHRDSCGAEDVLLLGQFMLRLDRHAYTHASMHTHTHMHVRAHTQHAL